MLKVRACRVEASDVGITSRSLNTRVVPVPSQVTLNITHIQSGSGYVPRLSDAIVGYGPRYVSWSE